MRNDAHRWMIETVMPITVVLMALAAAAWGQDASDPGPQLPADWRAQVEAIIEQRMMNQDAYAVDPSAPAEPAVAHVAPVDGGAMVAVDVAALRGTKAVSAARWYAKPFVAVREVARSTGEAVVEHPILSIAGGYLAVRGVQGKLDDDWDALTGNDDDKPAKASKSKTTSGAATAGEGGTVYAVTVAGDVNAPITIVGRDQGMAPEAALEE